MKYLLTTFLTTAVFVTSFTGNAPAQSGGGVTVAVLDFRNTSGVLSFDGLEQTVPEMLKTELSRSTYVQVLERSKLEGIFQELALGQTGLLDEKAAAKVGELAGARFIIQGEINRSQYGLRIDAHVVEVGTGRVLGEKVDGKGVQTVGKMVQLLAKNIIYNLTGNGRYTPKAKITAYPTIYFLGLTAISGAAATASHVTHRNAYNDYHEATALADFDKYYDRAKNYRITRNVLLGVTGALAITTGILAAANSASSNYVFAFQDEKGTPKLSLRPIFVHGEVGVRTSYHF